MVGACRWWTRLVVWAGTGWVLAGCGPEKSQLTAGPAMGKWNRRSVAGSLGHRYRPRVFPEGMPAMR